MVLWTGSEPRRARHLIPTGLPRRGELIAGCALALLLAHLLLAQLTLVLAAAFVVVSRASRWRLWWLLAPAVAGLAWTLAIGPDKALTGFAAGPSGILWHLAGGHLAGQAGHPLAGFADPRRWLPRQFPLAFVCAAAEAALIGWLDWLHTDEWAVPPPRPGLIAALRRSLAGNFIRSGAVVTPDGCALGVVPSTGAIAELRWAEANCGTLIVGVSDQEVTLAGLQIVHAALRRRKPVLVLDPGDAALSRALAAACQATGVSLLGHGDLGHGDLGHGALGHSGHRREDTGQAGDEHEGAGASQLWGRAVARRPKPAAPAATSPDARVGFGADPPPVEVRRVLLERSAALLPADSAELAGRACADLASLAADLRRIGVNGDALVWVPRGDQVPAQALSGLLRDCQDVGLAVVVAATSPSTANDLGGLVGATLIHRVADQGLAASIAPRTGTWLVPAAPATVSATVSATAPASQPPAAVGGTAGFFGDAGFRRPVPQDLVPVPVVPARTLLTLGQGEFVLAVSLPQPRLIATGRIVPARLPDSREERQ